MLLGSGEISILSTAESSAKPSPKELSWGDDWSRIGMYDSSKTAITTETECFVIGSRLLVNGTSVWENYTIEILLNYEYYGGDRSERWTHDVGGWTMEMFVDKSPYRFL